MGVVGIEGVHGRFSFDTFYQCLKGENITNVVRYVEQKNEKKVPGMSRASNLKAVGSSIIITDDSG